MTDVFISYSRRDTDFVKVLYEALDASTYDTWIDWQGIAPTTEWWKEIEAGIESSDNFLFVISPDSVASKYCLQEIDHAVRHNKRIIPVLRQDADMPQAITHIQRVAFREEDPFDTAFAELVAAINTDQDHKKTHTRLELRAIEWQQKEQDESYLLRGSDLEAAEQWLIQSSSGKEPIPTDLQRAYVATSAAGRRAANNRQRIVTGVLGALLLLASVAGGLAYAQYRTAQTALNEREAALTREEDARRLAEQRLQEAETAREQAQTAQAGEAAQRQLAEAKQREAEEALTQAEAAQQAEARQRQRAEQALVRAEEGETEANRQAQIAQEQTTIAERETLAAIQAKEQSAKQALNAEVLAQSIITDNLWLSNFNLEALTNGIATAQTVLNSSAQIQPDKRLRTAASLRQVLYTSQGKNRFEGHTASVNDVRFSPDGQTLASASFDETVRLWQPDGTPIAILEGHTASVSDVQFSPDGQTLVSNSDNGTVILWNFDLDDLITKSCDWLRDYMTNPATPEDERALCAEELGLPLNTAVPSRVNWLANVQGFWHGLFGPGNQDSSLVPRQLADQSK
mgnify:CR=1 FL=1